MRLITMLAVASALPLVVWAASYAYLAHYYRTWNLKGIKIHETGRYTLGQTVFYFNHFLRELFIDTLYTMALFDVYVAAAPPEMLTALDRHFALMLALLMLFLGWVVWRSIVKVGLQLTLLDLFQFRELDTVTQWGSHWQMHFLSTLALLLIAVVPSLLFTSQLSAFAVGVFAVFVLLSIFFRTGAKALRDKRWLMHGGREILTFIPLGIIPAFVPLLPNIQSLQIEQSGLLVGVIGLILAIAVYYLWEFLHADVSGLAQGGYKMPYLIASHFFEHVLDYVYMVLLMLTLLSLPITR